MSALLEAAARFIANHPAVCLVGVLGTAYLAGCATGALL